MARALRSPKCSARGRWSLPPKATTRERSETAEEAVLILAGLQLPFRAARAWFTLGEVRRRSRQKAASRAAFEALAAFEDLGATVWIERTQTELGRVASRRPAGSPLTDTERRVAELAAAGHTNREIAQALFMSVHTVEAHLTRIFRTVGVQVADRAGAGGFSTRYSRVA